MIILVQRCFSKQKFLGKVNGIMIFDDYDWTNTDEEHNTIHGVEAFLRGYQNRIYKERVVSINSQVFVTRKN